MRRATLSFLVVTGALAGLARADTIILKDGRILDEHKVIREQDVFLVRFQHGDVRIPASMVDEALITAEASADQNAGMAKKIEERKKYVEQLKALTEWRNRRKESTKHFDFESTVPPKIYASFRDRMESYFTEFSKMWNIKQPKDGRLLVCYYADEDTFQQVSNAGRGVLGYFRFVKPLELDIYYDRTDPGLAEDVMFHEANHYLQKLINPEFKMPHFPGESLAEYYGASAWDEQTKKLTVGLIQEGRLAEIEEDIAAGDLMPLEKMLLTEDMYEHYNWGWSLVHFLMNQEKYAKKFQRFVTNLALSKDVKRETRNYPGEQLSAVDGPEILRVFMKSLDLRDAKALAALEAEWHEYVKTKLQFVTPQGMEKAGFKAMATYPARPLRAQKMLKKAIDGGSKNPRAYDKLAGLIVQDGELPKVNEAIGLWRKAIELDPLCAHYYANLGHALIKMRNKDEGTRLVKLAKELDPDDPFLDLDLREKK